MSKYPSSWNVELVRNASGKAFYFVSRFSSATTVEYLNDSLGNTKCFNHRTSAEAARDGANDAVLHDYQTISTACEKRFQAGASRTQLVSPDGRRYRSMDSVKQAFLCGEAGESVFARRKVRGTNRYAWTCFGECK